MKTLLFTFNMLLIATSTNLFCSQETTKTSRKSNRLDEDGTTLCNRHRTSYHNGSVRMNNEKFAAQKKDAEQAQIKVRILKAPTKATPKKEASLIVGSRAWVKANPVAGR